MYNGKTFQSQKTIHTLKNLKLHIAESQVTHDFAIELSSMSM